MTEKLETNLWRLSAGNPSFLRGVTHPRRVYDVYLPPEKNSMGLTTYGKTVTYEPSDDKISEVEETNTPRTVFNLAEFMRGHEEEYIPSVTQPLRREVLDLANEGLTNSQAASRLSLSLRAFSNEISAMRTELEDSGILQEHDLVPITSFPNLKPNYLNALAKNGTIESTQYLYAWYTTSEAFSRFEKSRHTPEPISLHMPLHSFSNIMRVTQGVHSNLIRNKEGLTEVQIT